MWKVIDMIDSRNPLCSVNDLDGTFVVGKYGNICIDTIYDLDRNPRYSGRYGGILEEAKNILGTASKWEEKPIAITGLLRDFAVTNLDWFESGCYTIRHTKIGKPTKEILKIFATVPSVRFHIFTGSEKNLTNLFVQNRIAEYLPNVKIEVDATIIETDGRYFTGHIKEQKDKILGEKVSLSNSKNRANKTKKLTFNKISTSIGNSIPNDTGMARETTQGFIITGPITSYLNGREDDNIIYTSRENVSKELKKFLKSDAREIQLPLPGLNAVPIIRSRV